MAKKAINLLVGRASNSARSDNDANKALSTIAECINNMSEDITISGMAAVSRKEDIDVIIQQNKYDVILLDEKIGTTSIGAGSIKTWRDMNPRIRMILLIPDSKKGGMKIQSLFNSGYYNALYQSDFRGETIEKLILHDREKESARIYYGLPEEEPVVDAKATEVTPLPSEDVTASGEQNKLDTEKATSFVDKKSTISESEKILNDHHNETAAIPNIELGITENQLQEEAPKSNAPKRTDSLAASNIKETSAALWTCGCGEKNTGNFCTNCGKAKVGSVYYDDNQKNDDLTNYLQRSQENQVNEESDIVETMVNDMNYSRQERAVRRPAPTQKNLSEEYYEEEGYLDEDDQGLPSAMVPKRKMPFEPRFGGGKKELPSQFRDIKVDPTVASYGGYVIKPISDTVLIIEVPDAHFLNDVHVQEGALINLVTSRK